MQGEHQKYEQSPAPATLLFMGKMDTMMSQVKEALDKNLDDHKVIMEKLDKIGETYVRKEEFVFWRWILIVGMLLSIVIASIKFIFQQV